MSIRKESFFHLTSILSGHEEILITVDRVKEMIYIIFLGACEGTLACSTCHLVFEPEHFKKIPDDVTDEELDMLDLAYGLCDT